MDIALIDNNLKIETSIKEDDIVFYDVRKDPFVCYGLFDYKSEGRFKRMPEDVAKRVSENVAALNYHTAGGRVRFKTNSKYVAINVKMSFVTNFPHMTLAGTSGFDIYINEGDNSKYYGTFMPPVNMKNGYESIIYFSTVKEHDITINFPLYNVVDELFIGLQNNAELKKGNSYKNIKPILYYGSSITQGGCASRPGNSYQAIISRNINCDYINLGFSGSAKAEDAMAEYLSKLAISLLVIDYDHNASNIDYLNLTHQRFFNKIRDARNNLPIILISRPDFDKDEQNSILRRDIIYNTFINAVKHGDKNVYYIDGQTLFKGEGRDGCTVDGCHPNDLGFYRISETIGYHIKNILKI